MVAERIAARALRFAFDVRQGDLKKSTLFRFYEYLFTTFYPLACDMSDEIDSSYRAFEDSRISPLSITCTLSVLVAV